MKIKKEVINNIILNACTMSFYTIISLSSILLIITFLMNNFNESFKMTLIYDLVEILGITFNGFINETLMENNTINIFLFISIIYSISAIINRYKIYAENIYNLKRKAYKNLFISILVFLMLFFFLLFMLIFLIYSNFFITYIFQNHLIIKTISSIIEILIFNLLFSIIFIYLPPIKIKFNIIKKESLIVTLLIYLIFKLFILCFNLLYVKFKLISLIFVFSASGYLILIFHIIICYTIYKIYQKTN